MPSTFNPSPGGGNPGRRKGTRSPILPTRTKAHMPIGSIPAIDLRHVPHPRSLRRFKVEIMPLKAQYQVMKYHSIQNEASGRHTQIVESRVNRARKYAHQVKQALRKPTPRTFYPALIRFLSFQENLFNDLLRVRAEYESALQKIVQDSATHPQTREVISPLIEDARKAMVDFRISLWEIRSWLKKAQSNWKKAGSPSFSERRFQIDVDEIKRRFQD